jgi:cerevisin
MIMLKGGLSATQFLAHQQLITTAQLSASAFHGAAAQGADGIGHIYELDESLQGYAGKFTPDVIDYIRALPEVEYVELDSVVKTTEMPYDGSMVWDTPYDVSIDESVSAQSAHSQNLEKGAPWVSRRAM